jgi:serine O-acetyltransferase
MTLEVTGIDFTRLPNRILAHKFVDGLIEYLFPTHGNEDIQTLQQEKLRKQLEELLQPVQDRLYASVKDITAEFLSRLNNIYASLISDAKFFVTADPAAECVEEVIVAYPGFYAVTVYRVANILYSLNVPILPRLITEYAHTKTGIDIHPGATIGVPFFIDHGTGVVIGQTATIGNHVKLYQGVTLGALAVRKEQSGEKRHPTIEDNVIIYAGSCILGGKTTIGHDSVIGGNVWLTESVAPYSMVYHTNQVKVRDKSEMKEVIDFII